MTGPTKNPRRRIPIWATDTLGVKVPSRGSDALLDFLSSYRQINSFIAYLLHLVGSVEFTGVTAHNALVDTEHDPVKKQQLIDAWAGRRSPVNKLKTHRQFLLEVILVRHVENYLNFLSALLKEIFEAKPETLRSSEKIDLETVLRHASIDDLVRTVAERKVESLSYSSFSDLAEYFQERFHINLLTKEHEALVVDAIETRNISVHNRCHIDRRYVIRTKGDASQIGKIRGLNIDTVETIAICLASSAVAVDKTARKHLGVRGRNANQKLVSRNKPKT